MCYIVSQSTMKHQFSVYLEKEVWDQVPGQDDSHEHLTFTRRI